MKLPPVRFRVLTKAELLEWFTRCDYRDRFYFWKSTKLINLRLSLLRNNSTPPQYISSRASTTLEIIFGQHLSSFVAFCLIPPALWNDLTCSQFLTSEIKKVSEGYIWRLWRLLSCPILSLAKNGWTEIALWVGTFCPVVGAFWTNLDETRLILKFTDLNDWTYPKLIYKSSASSRMVARSFSSTTTRTSSISQRCCCLLSVFKTLTSIFEPVEPLINLL